MLGSTFVPQEIRCSVGSVHLKSLLAVVDVGRPDIVQDASDEEQLAIDFAALGRHGISVEGGVQKCPQAVIENGRMFCPPGQVQGSLR